MNKEVCVFHEKKKGRNSCPWLLIDRVKWLCAYVMCWPQRVGVSVCHFAFFVVATYRSCTSFPNFVSLTNSRAMMRGQDGCQSDARDCCY